MAFDWEVHLGPLLESHDVLGTIGCKWPQRNQTLLVEPQRRVLFEDRLILECEQIFPEGLGYEFFPKDLLVIPGDERANQTVTFEWQSMQAIPDSGQKHFIYNVAETHAINGPTYIFHERSLILTLFDKQPGPIRMVEFFSGGFGGWKRGAQLLAEGFNQSFCTIGIELDLHVASTYAISHRANLVRNMQSVKPEIFRHSEEDWVFCCDIWEDLWLPCISTWSPEIAVISSPCKPWSGASTSPGLSREDGRLLIRAILSCRFFRPRCIAIEQVPGFSNHPHRSWVNKTLLFCGYRMVWSKVVDLHTQSPTSRPRWLGLAVRIHDQIPDRTFAIWKRSQLITPREIDAVMPFSAETLQPLQVSEAAHAIASNPKCYKGPPIRSSEGQSILGTRIFGDQQCLPTFMAMYGSQHSFDMEYLQKHGFYGHFKQDLQSPFQIRYWHPIEVALIHGITSPCYLDDILAFSWLILGNMISQPHALLVLTDVCNRLRGNRIQIDEVMEYFQRHRFCASDVEPLSIRDGTIWLSKHTLAPQALQFRDPVFQINVSQLLDQVQHHIDFQCWIPTDGIVSAGQLIRRQQDKLEDLSEVSCAMISPTMSMNVDPPEFKSLQWTLTTGQTCYYFVKSTTFIPALVELWGKQVELQLGTTGFVLKTIDCTDVTWMNFTAEYPLMVVSMSGYFHFCSCAVDENLLISHNLPAGPAKWYDSFDAISAGQIYKPGQFVCDFPIRHGTSPCDAPFLLAAALQTECSMTWSASTDSIFLDIKGTEPAVMLMAEFWGHSIHVDDLRRLGRRCKISTEYDSGRVEFLPSGEKGACPPRIFREILSVTATRVFMDSHNSVGGLCVNCKWQGRLLWAGLLPPETPLANIMAILRHGLSLIGGPTELRLVSGGRNQTPETLLSDIRSSRGKVKLHAVFELSGGGPTKQQTRTVLRNSLASIFLEQGHDIQWVSSAVDSLVTKIGIPRLQAIVNMSSLVSKLSALTKLCSEIDLKIPGSTKTTSQLDFSGAPWNKKKIRKDASPIQAVDFTITSGFFQNEDGSSAVQLANLRAQACGVCILDPPTALEWLRGNNCISSDELGAFVIGQLPCETSLPVCQITAPCLNSSGQSVLLSGKFVQFGSKNIKFCQGNKTPSQPENCHLLAITLLRDDWSDEQWNQAVHNPVVFVKKILSSDNQDGALIAVWGRSLRQGRAPASPLQASSLQVHCTIASNKIDGVLRQSGFNRLYMTPKEPSGKLDLAFKILWVEGTLGEVTAIGARTPDCLGLVRGKQTFGLRFRSEKFAAAWEAIHPGTQPPVRPQGDLLFKISGLPFGCTASVIQDWSQAMSWEISAIKALGPQAWLVRGASHPKDGIHMFNTTPVLIQHLPPKSSKQMPVLLGPRAKPVDNDMSHFDPWANWTGPRLAPTTRDSSNSSQPVRQVTGPIEERFATQDATIAAIRTELHELAQKQDEQSKLNEHRFQQAETREKKNLSQMQSDMKTLQKDLEKSLTTSLNQNANTLDARLRELKELFTTVKRKQPGAGDESME